MLFVDLSALSRQQLRRLLDAAQRDGMESLANDIMTEMGKRDGMLAGHHHAPPPKPEPAYEASPARAQRPAGQWVFAAVAAGLVIGAFATWLVLEVDKHPSSAVAAPPPPRAAVALATLPPPPASAPIAQPAAAVEPPPAATPQPVRALAPVASEATCSGPACSDAGVQLLSRQLDDAYAEALAAHHAHRALLEERQAAWQAGLANVSDPARLAQAYEARIRKLKAATAAANRAASLQR